MQHNVQLTLSYEGNDSDHHEIDLYDVSQALVGFQRTIALTAHLIVNSEIITQAPSLKGAKVFALPAEEGSWKITAGVIFTGMYALGTTSNDNPIGHVVHSLYDYVISESLGFNVDYDKSLGQLYKEYESKKIVIPKIEVYQADSLIEKCSNAIKEIHRPIYKTKSATRAKVTSNIQGIERPIKGEFSSQTYDYIREIIVSDDEEIIKGRITSYNTNTFKGRVYVSAIGHPVSFELSDSAKTEDGFKLIVASISDNIHKKYESQWCEVCCRVYAITTRTGRLKGYKIIEIYHNDK